MDLSRPHETSHCRSILNFFIELDIEDNVTHDICHDSDGNEPLCATAEDREHFEVCVEFFLNTCMLLLLFLEMSF